MEYTQDFVKGRENREFYIAQFSTLLFFFFLNTEHYVHFPQILVVILSKIPLSYKFLLKANSMLSCSNNLRILIPPFHLNFLHISSVA